MSTSVPTMVSPSGSGALAASDRGRKKRRNSVSPTKPAAIESGSASGPRRSMR
jgi:hypothetical protein